VLRGRGALVVVARGGRVPHSPGPRSIQVRSCSSVERSMSWMSPQLSAWFGVVDRRSFQSSAYSRRATTRSTTASSRVLPLAPTGSPGRNADHPSSSATRTALLVTNLSSASRNRAASTMDTRSPSRRTVAVRPCVAASRSCLMPARGRGGLEMYGGHEYLSMYVVYVRYVIQPNLVGRSRQSRPAGCG
jgi:hypothetical protein